MRDKLQYPIVLEISKIPSMVQSRNTAWSTLIEEFSNTIGKGITVGQLKIY